MSINLVTCSSFFVHDTKTQGYSWAQRNSYQFVTQTPPPPPHGPKNGATQRRIPSIPCASPPHKQSTRTEQLVFEQLSLLASDALLRTITFLVPKKMSFSSNRIPVSPRSATFPTLPPLLYSLLETRKTFSPLLLRVVVCPKLVCSSF